MVAQWGAVIPASVWAWMLVGGAYAVEPPPSLLTVAERSNYQATSRHAEVVALCRALADASPLVKYREFGVTVEGRPLPLLIVAEPPVNSPAEATRSGKAVILVFANIHAGEVDGKEAVLMLARDLALAAQRPALSNVVLMIVPNLNPDGNERFDRGNRPGQVGPVEGMGIRENAQGLDLNRDYIKLESPEIRALVKLVTDGKPHLLIDCHTTNGSWHRYTLTYDANRHPLSDGRLIRLAREVLVPDATRRLEQSGGWKSFYYGNFNREHSAWESFPLEPRFGTHYFAVRNRVAVLSESYTYAPYRDRVLASRDFCRSVIDFTAEHREQLTSAVATAEREASDASKPRQVPIRVKAAALPGPHTILGWEEKEENGKPVRTETPKDYSVAFWGGAEPTLSVLRPAAYLFPPQYQSAAETLQRHGIPVLELREEIELDVEVYRVSQLTRAVEPFQKHQLARVEASLRSEARRVPAGWFLVRTAHPLGDFATFLLEPQSDDGLTAWNFFDQGLAEGADFPVVRLPNWLPLLTTSRPPPPELRVTGRRITMAALFDPPADDGSGSLHGQAINLGGAPIAPPIWTPRGDQYLQTRDGQLYRVRPDNGRLSPLVADAEKWRKSLAALPAIGEKASAALARVGTHQLNPEQTGALIEHGNDLYYATLDGGGAVRLTASPEREEVATFSPDGRFVAFVRNGDLYVVDIATQTERRLTTDGGGRVSNGKADWVYFEELFFRKWQAYWWSPDSRRIVFLRLDDSPVHDFTVLDPIPPRQNVERTAYPKAGDPLPLVSIGCATVAGGDPVMADLGSYSPTDRLVSRIGFTPDSAAVYAYVLNRKQTWLDFVRVTPDDGRVQRLFRETTKAWVDDHGPPEYLSDGSFLFSSERDGYRHYYRYAADGKLIGRVTEGPWEARSLHRIDEASGWVYLSATKDGSLGNNLYRARLDGSALERLTDAAGTHQVTLGKSGTYFIDSHSHRGGPTRVHLRSLDGAAARVLDSNPVHALDDFTLGATEHVEIPTPDGFTLDGVLIFPPDFNAERPKKYPVWVKTYGGPHAQTVRDAWMGGYVEDRAHASAGFIVLHVDPRPASGKGAVSTWTAYRQLGKQELADLEHAVRWLGQRAYVDSNRVGLSGYSYGGFLTCYALTHSKLFAAGVAGAPVTDWRNYDAIYTERYMDTPQDNPDGYQASSVVAAAKDLHGKLLLVHGVMDDNVHLQNTLQLLGALQAADRYAELQLYPRSRHGVGGKHFAKLSFEFMARHLSP